MLTRNASCTALAGAALLAVVSIGFAPLSVQAAEPGMEEVIVVAPRVMYEQERRIGSHNVSSGSMLEARVSYADLDLARTEDVARLESRLEAAANRACRQLAKESPMGEPRTSACIRQAVSEAKSQLSDAVEEKAGIISW